MPTPPSPVLSEQPALPHMTPRECNVLDLLLKGLITKQIALQLGLAAPTVRAHEKSLREKFEAHHRGHLLVKALERGYRPQA